MLTTFHPDLRFGFVLNLRVRCRSYQHRRPSFSVCTTIGLRCSRAGTHFLKQRLGFTKSPSAPSRSRDSHSSLSLSPSRSSFSHSQSLSRLPRTAPSPSLLSQLNMVKKGSSTKTPNASSGPRRSATMREASTGKNQTNARSLSMMEHIKNLAVWASRDAGIPSLGALFGHQLAAASESLGIPVDPSLYTCQRCESILHPGYNCSVRIETNKINLHHKGKKAMLQPRNNIVYTCHFCSHRNINRGAPRNIAPPKTKPCSKPTPRAHEPTSSIEPKTINTVANTIPGPVGSINEPRGKMGIVDICDIRETKDDAAGSGPVTPLTKPSLTLLESKMKKRNRSGAKKTTTSAVNDEKSMNTSNRKRRKSWTSLKEIAEINDNDYGKRFTNLTVPFPMQ